jgi:type IV pilus secretin PilQ/predicted competence protein
LVAAWGIGLLVSGCAQQAVWREPSAVATELLCAEVPPVGPNAAAATAPARIEDTGPLLSPGTGNSSVPSAAGSAELPAAPPAPMPEEIQTPRPATPKARPAGIAAPPAPRDEQSVAETATGPAPLVDPAVGAAPISLHLDDVEIRKALEIISRQAKMNVLVSPAVSGQVTVDLRDVSVEETLRAVLKSCRLAATREKGILYVCTAAEQRQANDQEALVRVYRLKYVKAADLMKMVKPLLTKQGVLAASPQSEVGIKADSEKGGGDSLAGGEAMIVQDNQRVLDRIDHIVAELDVEPVQVLIEAVILTVTLENDRTLGMNYGVLDRAQGGILTLVGSGAALNSAAGFNPASVLAAGGMVADGNQSGFADSTQGLKFGFVTNNLSGFITALQTYGDTKILASPRLLVLNKQRADLQLGDRLAYTTITQTQTSTVQQVNFMDVGTQLHLRPFVTSGGIIRMEVHPEQSEGSLVDGLPQTTSAQITTNVMIPDGATIVIGGLMSKTDSIQDQGVPWLCELPWIGVLFRQRVTTHQKSELVVILTPHIWQPRAPGTAPGTELPAGAVAPPGLVPDPCLHLESHADAPRPDFPR